jgi:hypothetical protein
VNQGGDGDAGLLERRARWLLRAYPADYRADRGEEIIGTLLEATPPGRDWPPSREAVSLAAAGLRARRAANLRQGLAASLRQTAVVGAAAYLAQLPSLAIGAGVWSAHRGHFLYLWSHEYQGAFFELAILAIALLAAAWSGRRALVVAVAVAALILAVIATIRTQEWDLMRVLAEFAGPAVPVFLLCARRTERPPARLLWLLFLPVAVASAESLANVPPALFAAPTASTTLLYPYASGLSLVTVIVAVCWLATDVRPLAGLVLAFTVTRVMYGFVYLSSAGTAATDVISLWITALVILAGALAWLLRRRTRACAPAAS